MTVKSTLLERWIGSGRSDRSHRSRVGPLIVGAGTVMSLAAGFGGLALAMELAAGASLWLHPAVESGDLSSNDSDHDSDHMESDHA